MNRDRVHCGLRSDPSQFIGVGSALPCFHFVGSSSTMILGIKDLQPSDHTLASGLSISKELDFVC